jgi:lipopolysaccharide transport system ATP-binding protein
MKEDAIIFHKVSKHFPHYHHIKGGIKHLIVNFREALQSLRHPPREVLKEVSFAVGKGETFGIIGRNGAGKSTSLSLIAGVIRPSSGRVVVRGRVSPLLELGAGFHPELTGRENVTLNGVLLGLSRKEVARKMEQIIEFAEMEEFIDQPTRTYSSGMLARLGFSVAAHSDPEILILDEVLAVGDQQFQKKCMDKMSEFKRKGVTIVLVSHSMDDIRSICTTVGWINNHVMKIGAVEEIITAYLQSP